MASFRGPDLNVSAQGVLIVEHDEENEKVILRYKCDQQYDRPVEIKLSYQESVDLLNKVSTLLVPFFQFDVNADEGVKDVSIVDEPPPSAVDEEPTPETPASEGSFSQMTLTGEQPKDVQV